MVVTFTIGFLPYIMKLKGRNRYADLRRRKRPRDEGMGLKGWP